MRLLAPAATDRQLFASYAEGDQRAREALAARHLPLARRLAHRYRHSSEHQDDLEQVAALSLLRAIDRYDPTIGPFQPYLSQTVSGHLKRHFRDHSWDLRLPRKLQEQCLKLTKVIERLAAEHGRSPTTAQLMEETGWTAEQVAETLAAGDAYSIGSLDVPLPTADDATPAVSGDLIGAEDPAFAVAEQRVTLRPLIAELSARQKTVLRLRFVEGLTQTEIGAQIGVSQMHVSRLIRQALATMGNSASLRDSPR